MSDFELMLQKKKDEMKKRRRKRRDVDIINDNDDLIDDLIRRMMEAAEVSVHDIQCVKKSPPPLRTCGNFSEMIRNFST